MNDRDYEVLFDDRKFAAKQAKLILEKLYQDTTINEQEVFVLLFKVIEFENRLDLIEKKLGIKNV